MNPMPFAALHPSPSRLTSTASSAAGGASQRTATTVAGSSFLSSDDGDEAEDDDDYVNIASEDAQGDEMTMAATADVTNSIAANTRSAKSRGMLFIAHRGNTNGPNPPLENQPHYLLSALAQGFDVEVDAWYDPPTNQWALGHDGPDHPIEYDFLLQPRVWVHAKNTAALREMAKDARVHCFAHDKDEYTLTSKGYIWAYPDVTLAGKQCIAVMYTDPYEVLDREDVGGVCHDIVGPLRERYLQMMAGREDVDIDAEEDRKPAALPNFRGEDEVDGDALGADDGRCEDDRKPAAKPVDGNDRQPSGKPTNSDRSVNTAGDQRFLCAICLDIVSDEPVVTRCGHLYCWPCLYQWLQPGMLLGEYRTAFGGNGASLPSNNSVGGGLNFLSGGNHAYLPPQTDRPYNPSGRAFNERRRCCPICKAGCTVDSVVPIYIHVHSEAGESGLSPTNDVAGGDSGSVNGDDDGNEGRRLSNDSLASLDVDHDSAEGSTGRLPFAAAASAPLDASAANAATSDNALDSMDDPTNVNLGLRNRRRNAHDPNLQQSKRQRQQSADVHDPTTGDPSLCESPTRNPQGSHTFSAHDTPVHRNSRGVLDGANAVAADGSTADVPSRPIPAGHTPLGGQRNPIDVRRDASQPELNHERAASSGMASSSPFRIALRPRHPPRALTTPPYPGQAGLRGNDPHRPDFDVPFSRAYAAHHRHGRLTSALLGIVDAVDRAAVGSGGGIAQPPPAPAVPTLHRSDGGMGGIGRASEQGAGAGADEYGSGAGYEEESSLAMAREFLSRLLLMLACFVILCLLLF